MKKKVRKVEKEGKKNPKLLTGMIAENENKLDFGGLPIVSLKKNLGCG